MYKQLSVIMLIFGVLVFGGCTAQINDNTNNNSTNNVIDNNTNSNNNNEGNQAHTCTNEEKQQVACTMDYNPVCGNDGITYGNACSACGSGKIDSWIRGECPVNNEEHICTAEEKQNKICTREYNPVCAKVDNGIRCIKAPCPSVDLKTYATGCTACADEKVYSYTMGECSSTEITNTTTTTKPATGKEVACSNTDGTQTLTLNQAIEIAKTSECGDNLVVGCSCYESFNYEDGVCNPKCLSQGCKMASMPCEKSYFCNEGTSTFWINLNITKEGCNPACVINVETKKAEINWRCTGLKPKCDTCPMLSPTAPGFCANGTIVAGLVDECGCTGAPKCI